MTVHRIRPEVVAHTVCPNGHTDVVEAINPVVIGEWLDECSWPSAFDFCMTCDEPIASVDVEVRR